jgi:hypothetical protein
MVNLGLRDCALSSGLRIGESMPVQNEAAFHSTGPNCGIPATGSEDYRIGAVIALELACPFG